MEIQNLQPILSGNYPITITEITEGPRGFVAETFIITCTSGEKYFVKFIDKPNFISKLKSSIVIQAEIYARSLKKMNYPIKTNIGELYIETESGVIALYNFIDAPQSYEYNLKAMGRLEASLHIISTDALEPINKEDFKTGEAFEFLDKFENTLRYSGTDPIELQLKEVFSNQTDQIRKDYKQFLELNAICKTQKHNFVFIHNDAGGNTLVKSPTDLYLIDWDDIVLGPAERDIWTLCDKPEFVEGYNEIRPNFQINESLYHYYILKLYFTYIVHHLHEIQNAKPHEYRQKHLHRLIKEVVDETAWIDRFLKIARS